MSTADQPFFVAPPGFTRQQWDTFDQQGYLVLENVLNDHEINRYIEAIDRIAAAEKSHCAGQALYLDNVVERDATFAELIDHPRHVGFAYDLYGEQLKLHRSRMFVRPRGEANARVWHSDGPRALPYKVFSPRLPLQLQIGYWLTDMPEPHMGNLVVLPGSHRRPYLDAYCTTDRLPGEHIILLKRGSMTVMNADLWHRGDRNDSDRVRKSLYMAYCPSWVTSADRIQSDPRWLETLSRERRIIMRSYGHSYDNAQPPVEDFPLFLDRNTQLDRDEGVYRPSIKLHRRKRRTTIENWSSE